MANKGESQQKEGWQLIALSSDVPYKQPIARRRLNDEYVLFRDNENTICILEDRCAHRRAPLSLGWVTEQGTIQCPYHGWVYQGQTGQCAEIPNLSTTEATPQYKVRSFISKEQHGFVYLWQGEPQSIECKPLENFRLESKQIGGESSQLMTFGCKQLLDTLLDSPSLLLTFNGVTIIDDHWMGEPRFDGQLFTIDRAADWTYKAKKRKQVASDLPLVLRIQLDYRLSMANIELIDEHNKVLAQVLLACQAATPCVTEVLWRWAKSSIDETTYSKTQYTAFMKLNFSAEKHIDPSALISVKPYISSIFRGQIEASL